MGCAECIVVCPSKAVKINWSESYATIQERIVEYAKGVVQAKAGKTGYISFVMDVAPQCDCYPFSDASIVPNVGILLSLDPVAVDKASADLINKQPGLPGTALKNLKPGSDKFRSLYPKLDWTVQINHAEALGLGSGAYALVAA
jgi:uncharacterized Fe-S center protein